MLYKLDILTRWPFFFWAIIRTKRPTWRVRAKFRQKFDESSQRFYQNEKSIVENKKVKDH